jgi:hypothetical protein
MKIYHPNTREREREREGEKEVGLSLLGTLVFVSARQYPKRGCKLVVLRSIIIDKPTLIIASQTM